MAVVFSLVPTLGAFCALAYTMTCFTLVFLSHMLVEVITLPL